MSRIYSRENRNYILSKRNRYKAYKQTIGENTMSTTEESYRCPKCRQYESYMYNDFDEVVSYVNCSCRKIKPTEPGQRKPLDIAFDELLKVISMHKRDA